MEFYVDKYSCKLSDDGSFEVSHSLPGGNDVHNFGSLGLPVEKLTSDLLWAATSDDEHYDSEPLVEVAERQLHYYFWELVNQGITEEDCTLAEDADFDTFFEYYRGKQGLESSLLEALLVIYGDDESRLKYNLLVNSLEFNIRGIEEAHEGLKAVDINNLTPSERLEYRRTLEESEARFQALREAQRQILRRSTQF